MNCPYCKSEISALEAINKELLRVLETFAKGQVFTRVHIDEADFTHNKAEVVKHVSEVSAAAVVRMLFAECETRAILHRELARARFDVPLSMCLEPREPT